MIRHAFTLIELLMVIVIIALLAALLFPVFAAAKQDGYKGAAIAQCSQLSKAMMLYVADNDGDYAPSTNYGAPESSPDRVWVNTLYPYIKNQLVFVAPGSKGAYVTKWADRGKMSIGMNSATALDPNGCDEEQKVKNNCRGFTSSASFDQKEQPETIPIFAFTPYGETSKGYRGFEFNPYNGIPNPKKPHEGPPLTADIDLVAKLPLPPDLLKPVLCPYHSTGKNTGVAPVIMAGGNAKVYSAAQILSGNTNLKWRFR